MASFATPTDLAAYLQTTVDTASAQLLLDLASATIRSYCGWPISQVTDDIATLCGNGSETLFLPSLNVTAVSSIVAGGVALATVPDEVRGVCLAIAARTYQGQSASQEAAGSYSITYGVPDLSAMDRYKLITVA